MYVAEYKIINNINFAKVHLFVKIFCTDHYWSTNILK